MASYLQWARKRAVSRVAWVCGDEQALVRDVLDAWSGVAPGNPVVLFAGDCPERDVWDALLTDPPPGGRRVTVWGAERLRALGNVALLAGPDADGTAYTVFVSAEADFARAEREGKKALAPHLAALQASRAGQLIRCCRPSDEEAVVQLVARWWPGAGANLAADVLGLCGGSLTAARQACDKAVRAGLEPTLAMAELACPDGPGPGLADLLIAGDRRGALARASGLGHRETGAALGLLAARLAALAEIGELRRRGQPLYRLDRYLARLLGPHAAGYGPDRISRCREVLAFLESWWRAGADEGIAESLVALWQPR